MCFRLRILRLQLNQLATESCEIKISFKKFNNN